MSCGAKPSVQISGTRGQGLGSHLCGRISVTRCPIPDHIRQYDGLYQSEGQCAEYGLLVARGALWRMVIRLETRKLQGKIAEGQSPESGAGIEKVECCDNEGAPRGRRGWD